MTGFGRLLGDLNRAGVRYVVVGGIAVIRHGVVRATRDLDVVIETDEETAVRLGAFRIPTRGWPLHFRTEHGLIDLLAPLPAPLDLNGLLSRSDERVWTG